MSAPSLRSIAVNDPVKNSSNRFLHNRISTAKYNALTFLPKFLKEQFSKYANVFFLFTGCIQQIDGVSPTSRFTTIIPLAVVLAASAAKEVVEDYKRHRSDDEVNNRICKRLEGGQFVPVKWTDVSVGDLIRVENNEAFPADLILLSSSEPDALCYIETSNLDGETNLKIRQGKTETASILSSAEASKMSGEIISELPNNSLYTFEGTMTLNGQKTFPLEPMQILLRGAMLKNTRWVYGIAVFTGHESKLMRNATSAPIKQTSVEKMTNKQILLLFWILLALSLFSAIGAATYVSNYKDRTFYLFPFGVVSSQATADFFLNFLTFIVLYNNLIPISLMVTMEVVKLQQAYLINCDLDMFYEKHDTPALARTSSLVEELGQIEYVFSDKTGTLTCNEMEFKESSIGGYAYAETVQDAKKARSDAATGKDIGQYDFKQLRMHMLEMSHMDAKKKRRAEVVNEFFTLLAVCHTVIPERIGDAEGTSTTPQPESILYQASSPDEGALVKGAQSLGYFFHTRRPKSVIVNVDNKPQEFEILNVCEFNSTRKRMSTIVRCPDKNIKIYVKGADTVILERLKRDPSFPTSSPESLVATNPFVESTLTHLEDYATEGLRTLCIAVRDISEQEYADWCVIYEKAANTVNNRGDELDKAAELIEKDLFLLGATAIEDKLQDGVPDTIYTLAQASIKLWVLTGDRQETAINIGYSCRLLTEDMNLIIINEETKEATKAMIVKKLNHIKATASFSNTPLTATRYDPERRNAGFMQRTLANLAYFGHFFGVSKKKTFPVDDKDHLLSRSTNAAASPDDIEMTAATAPNYINLRAEDIDSSQLDALALIIDGKSLKFALDAELELLFLELATLCKSVICCRVSPLQKALVVKLVRDKLNALTLAIGDGANDVGMIQAAHVGVGISGLEGLQAARSADFAICQFRYLKKLLLIHGSWSYQRLSKLILFSFYKNITLYMTQFWFSFYNGFSGQTIYESWIISLYNVCFTLLPPFAIGVFDQFISSRMLDRYPAMYLLGQQKEFFNVPLFWGWAFNAIYHSIVLYFLVFVSLGKDDMVLGTPAGYPGESGGMFMVGTLLYTCVLCTVLLKAALVVDHWTKYTFLAIPGSFIVWLIFLPIYSTVAPRLNLSVELTGIASPLLGNATFWFTIVIVPLICIARDYVWKYTKRQYRTKSYHIAQEIQKYSIPDYRPHADRFRKAVHKVRLIQRIRRTRGFAFSQSDSGQANLIRKYDTTQKKPTGM